MKKLLFILLLLPALSNAQVNLDSLWGVWNDATQADTNRLKAMQKISLKYLYTQSDSAFYFAQLRLDFAKEKGQKKHMASALSTQGNSIDDPMTSIVYHTKSLKILEEIGDKNIIPLALNNIGGMYGKQGNYEKTNDYFTRSLKIYKEIGDKNGIAYSLNNIGGNYNRQGYYAQAIDNHTKSLEIEEEIGDKNGIAYSLHNIGTIYYNQLNYEKANDCFTRSLKIYKEIEDKYGIAYSLNMIGKASYYQGDFDKAMNYSKRSLAIDQEIGEINGIKSTAKRLWTWNKELGRFKESLEMHELYIETRDSIVNVDMQKKNIQQKYKYEYEKQAAADSVKAAEVGKVTDALLTAEKAENKQHQQQQYFLYAGLFLALLFGGFIFNRFKVANKQKGIIEQQKQKVEEAHKEITDSINYAERIQRSFLATDALLNEHLKEYFVYFNPKEAVSGDFYWAGKLNDGSFAMVNADSTGHGVPGAIMSILNVSSIEKAVENRATTPEDIFNQTRQTIIKRLKKDGSEEGGKDGMDASLISFNSAKTKMTYVAAQNPIWIIREGELTEIKPEKMPVGKHNNDHVPFNGGEYEVLKGDQIYTLTDGFQDQFGGPKGKKFMVKKMREYVLSISNLPMTEQHQKITETFSNWKGDVEQVDDVCVIGVKI